MSSPQPRKSMDENGQSTLMRPSSKDDLSGTTAEQKQAFNSSDGEHNPKPQALLPPTNPEHGTQGDKLVIALVGLPARGKTYIAYKIKRYLNFFHGAPCEVFNVGNYRRKKYAAQTPCEMFDARNEDGMKMRMDCAESALEDLVAFIDAGMDLGRVAVFDATNCTRARRTWLVDQLQPRLQSKSHIIFVESVCEDQALIDSNIRATMRNMPDYVGLDQDEALRDFHGRIDQYAKQYQPLDQTLDRGFSWIKTVDGGQQVLLKRVCVCVCVSIYLYTHTCRHTCVRACVHACMHAYIHAYGGF